MRGERDQSDLPEIQPQGFFQQRVNGGDERLHRVVQQMAKADGKKDGKDGLCGGLSRRTLLKRSDIGFGGHLCLQLSNGFCVILDHEFYLAADARRRVR